MKSMKEMVMMVVVAVVAAGAIYVVANKMMNKQDVKIQAVKLNNDGTITESGSDDPANQKKLNQNDENEPTKKPVKKAEDAVAKAEDAVAKAAKK